MSRTVAIARGLPPAAVAIADSEGLAAASMRRVAAALGTASASLYRYVTNRDELLALMADAVTAELDLGGLPTAHGWRHDVLTVAHALRAHYRRHPWMLDVLPSATGAQGLGPAAIDYLEAVLGALSPLDSDPRRKLEQAVTAATTGSRERPSDEATSFTVPPGI